MKRLDSKKDHTRYLVVSLLNYLVNNGTVEWHIVMVRNADTLAAWIEKTTFVNTKGSLLDFVQTWAAKQADGPFGEGYSRLFQLVYKRVPEIVPEVLVLPYEDTSLSQMRIVQEVTVHCDNVMNTTELFVETLNFNQGYIGDNDLARDLHTQCKQLKITNDKWLERVDLNEAMTGSFYSSSFVDSVV